MQARGTRCVHCTELLPMKSAFCLSCGTPQSSTSTSSHAAILCASCSVEVHASTKFCPGCGAAIHRRGSLAFTTPTTSAVTQTLPSSSSRRSHGLDMSDIEEKRRLDQTLTQVDRAREIAAAKRAMADAKLAHLERNMRPSVVSKAASSAQKSRKPSADPRLPVPSPPTSDHLLCVHCGVLGSLRSKFCSSCGRNPSQPVVPAPSMPDLPSPLPLSSHRLRQPSSTSSSPSCPQCHAPLIVPDAKFCPSCGATTGLPTTSSSYIVPASTTRTSRPTSSAPTTSRAPMAAASRYLSAAASAATSSTTPPPSIPSVAPPSFPSPPSFGTAFVPPEQGTGHVYTISQTISRSVTYNAS
ncbi:hypothetical protein H257_00129 [Aphanomyces astaci]|uniref:DZANK-type domain-containing protein n=1 Tax=Aphanomyces astaci TaxID=112090 RepID=W4H9I2_APHAT|nr:hypothetical protein H257_00129 [Aphanomyces astaci]ETV88567.1 hypothetical protein H257_00129 [Aphanomyces astaci]|eukprot:XP_009820967.1 hypothetical protein H257_00129 [Aphanomyces astaci]